MEIQGKTVKRNRDRLSELPEFIIHQILSYLSTDEAARTTVLSKTWLQSYSTSPVLDFNERLFSKSPGIEETRYPFFNLVNKTLLRYHSQNLRIHKLKITVSCVHHTPAYRLLLDESLGLAFDNAVRELDILILRADKFSLYTLPPTMFDSPKALTYLSVYKCKFPENVATTSQLRNPIIFPFLKTLNLHSVIIDDLMLRKLLSGSPSLEEININRVSGLKDFKVTNLGKLKTFNIALLISDNNTVEIDIEDAPSLHCLKYRRSLNMPCLLKVGRAQNLKNLELLEVSISDSYLKELITKFPSLEELKFYACNGFERINIVNDSLKHLKLVYCKNLVEAKIDAPSLLELDYSGENALSLSLYNTPQELMTSIQIYITHDRPNRPTNAWFHRLRELLKSVTQARVSFCILHQRIQFRTALDNRANPLPLEHQSENFMPELNPSSSLFAVFLDTLFSSSRPTTITCLLAPAYVNFVKFLGGELITATRNPNCCSCVQTKCWRHYLKDIKVEVSEVGQDVWQPLHLENSLPEVKYLHKDHIRFNLNWYATLNAQI